MLDVATPPKQNFDINPANGMVEGPSGAIHGHSRIGGLKVNLYLKIFTHIMA